MVYINPARGADGLGFRVAVAKIRAAIGGATVIVDPAETDVNEESLLLERAGSHGAAGAPKNRSVDDLRPGPTRLQQAAQAGARSQWEHRAEAVGHRRALFGRGPDDCKS